MFDNKLINYKPEIFDCSNFWPTYYTSKDGLIFSLCPFSAIFLLYDTIKCWKSWIYPQIPGGPKADTCFYFNFCDNFCKCILILTNFSLLGTEQETYDV